MASGASSRLSIAAQQGQSALSPQQKKFNTLIRRIATQRELLASWEEATALYRQRHAGELEPLLAECRALNAELAQFLDQAAARPGLSKAERQTLHELIRSLAAQLMDGEHRDAMKALYNKYSEVDFDTEQQQAQTALRSLVQEQFGIDLGEDVDLNSTEDVLRRLQQQMQAAQAHAEETREHRRAARPRKPSARERRLQEAAQQAGQSVREVYRKLASALHPDREPDPRERKRKTALMQRVNQAYAANNLLDMLQLQLEVEQIDPQHIGNLSEQRLRHYNQVLAEQLVELQQETQAAEQSFKLRFGLGPYDKLAPGRVMLHLRAQLQQLQFDIHQLTRQRRLLEDAAYFKRWLNEERKKARAFDNALPEALFDRWR